VSRGFYLIILSGLHFQPLVAVHYCPVVLQGTSVITEPILAYSAVLNFLFFILQRTATFHL
jgi:hypothetical protein